MEMNEFLNRDEEVEVEADPEELDVQKAVVESLAADKAEQDERIKDLMHENKVLRSEISALKEKLAAQNAALANVGDVLAKNLEKEASNMVALLDRPVQIADKFVGETRDHVLEAIRDARNLAEKEGYHRRAQLLEGVLVSNEPVGELAKRRSQLLKLFGDNANILTGEVINELDNRCIPYKKGEEYLLPSEIVKAIY